MNPLPEESQGTCDAALPPPCPEAASYVAAAKELYLRLDRSCGWHREDVIGCIILSGFAFRADYVARGREPTEEEWGFAAGAVFRDFWTYAKDLVHLAGWCPLATEPADLGEAFVCFVTWQETHFEAALNWDNEPSSSDRVKRTRAIWEHLEKCAALGKRVDVAVLRSDVRKTLTEAGLRGADGRDPLTTKEVRAEATLLERAADQARKSTIYYDRLGRGRISWRTCKDLHPNRGQRMPRVTRRRELGRVLHGRGATDAAEGTADQTKMDRDLIAADDLRQLQAEVATIHEQRDLKLDMGRLLEGVRPLVRERGPAAEAALAYLAPVVLHSGTKLSRKEACQTASPPVTPDALRHQEKWLRPRLEAIAAKLGLE